VLLHSINAAASSYEMKPLFERYRGRRRVYALDLPGFGFSDRSDREYTPELYVRAMLEFLDSQVGAAADVIALSLTSEFAARAALSRPEFFRTLTLISPTGFGDRSPDSSETLRRALSVPVWARPVFDLLVSKPGIAYFLRRSFAGPVDAGLADYAYATAHQPGARYAPFWFISGALFTPDVRDAYYARLRLPVLVLYDEDGYVTFDRLPDFARQHANWTATRIAGTRGLPHFERPAETAAALDRFWAERMTA
jgi:pimeloyl-ACP methyl ester carboxylesterase